MKITLLFPTKNQSDKLLKNIREQVIPYFDAASIAYDGLIAASGSTQAEYRKLEEGLKSLPMNFSLLPYDPVPGKGHNLRSGLLAAEGDYVLFMDSDLSTSLDTFERMKPYLGKADMVIASRYAEDSLIPIKQPFVRRFVSASSRFIIKALFHFKGLTDTQCGFKLIRGEVGREMAKRQIVEGFAFDCEYLYMCKLNDLKVVEVPCTWRNDEDSTLSAFKASVVFFKDLLRIKAHRRHYFFGKEKNNADR